MINDPDFYRKVLDNLYDGVYFVDTDRRITYWSKGAEQLTGYKSSDVVGQRCSDNILTHVNEEGMCLCDGRCPLLETMTEGHRCEAEVYLLHRDGHRLPVQIRAAPLRDSEGQIVGAVEIFNDNSSKLALVDRVRDLQETVLLDPLTDLPNRRFISMQLKSKLEEMARYGLSFGVLFIDIDHFKELNDTYGHAAGDKALKMVGNTMSNALRPFDVVGRWGGEEFLVITPNVDEGSLKNIGDRLRSLVEQSSLRTESGLVRTTISVGGTISQREDDEDRLVKRADQLMYESKASGRNAVTVK